MNQLDTPPRQPESAESSPDEPQLSWWERMQEAAMWKWAAAYWAVSWLVLRIEAIIGKNIGITDEVREMLTYALIAGLPFVLAFAWYHGERKLTKVSLGEFAIIGLLAVITFGFFRQRYVAPDSEPTTLDRVANGIAPNAQFVNDPATNAARIAVLPLKNLSTDQKQQFFSDGLAEDIAIAVARIPGLRVAARTSSFAFRDAHVPADSIGRALSVEHLLEGSVRKVGEDLRITVSLIEAANNMQLWSESFVKNAEEVYALHEEIARAVAKALQLDVKGKNVISSPGRVKPKAYALLLEGRDVMMSNRSEADSLRRAIQLLQQAYEQDPSLLIARSHEASATYALAHRELDNRDSLLQLAKALNEAVLEENPDELTALATAGYYAAFIDQDYELADSLFSRSLQLDPSRALSRANYSFSLMRQGNAERALEEARKAIALGPADMSAQHMAAFVFFNLQDFEGAQYACENILRLDPSNASFRVSLASCYSYLDKHIDATREADLAILPNAFDPEVVATAAVVHARAGNELLARSLLNRVDGGQHVLRAGAYAALGDTARVIALLDSAQQVGDRHLVVLDRDPALRNWREVPGMERFFSVQ